ncbi:hypothetical protein VZO05_01380 [Aggregatilineales bacterium SYSU G02658]
MRLALAWVWLIVGGYALAQEVILNADGPVRVPLTIPENTRVTITALGFDEVDTVLTLVNDAQQVVAYSDDRMVNGELVRDAQLVHDQPGEYVLLVDSFNGVSVGRVELAIDQALRPTLRLGDELTLTLEQLRPLRLRLLLEESSVVRFTAVSADRRADLIAWVKLDDEIVQRADDWPRRDEPQMLFNVDAVWDLPPGEYDLWISNWLWRSSEVRVTLQAAE